MFYNQHITTALFTIGKKLLFCYKSSYNSTVQLYILLLEIKYWDIFENDQLIDPDEDVI